MSDPLPAVREDDSGLRGGPDCFYCRSAVGTPHGADCVAIKKRVRVRLVVEYEIEVPHSWDEEVILFHRHDSSWCQSNALDELEALAAGNAASCLCGLLRFEVLETTEPGPYSKSMPAAAQFIQGH